MEIPAISKFSVVKPLCEYLDIENPDLSELVGPMELYDAVCTICDHYGIDKPDISENAAESVEHILSKIRKPRGR